MCLKLDKYFLLIPLIPHPAGSRRRRVYTPLIPLTLSQTAFPVADTHTKRGGIHGDQNQAREYRLYIFLNRLFARGENLKLAFLHWCELINQGHKYR